jgi:TrmH family RNA methyltransferase
MGDRQTLPLPRSTYELEIILVGVTHPGNLGAVCRAMLNYGFSGLRLVQPRCLPDDEEARNRAKHAGRILDQCTVFDSIESATQDCSMIIGTSGKREIGTKTSFRHFSYPWEMSERLLEFDGKVALIFGEEGKGLSTPELESCDFLVTLPTWEGYPISNLSHAVNVCVYELHKSRVTLGQGKDPALPNIVPLQRNMNPKLKKILSKGIDELGQSLPGNNDRKTSFSHTLRRGLMRSMPTNDEATRLIGGLLDATTALQFVEGDTNWRRQRRRKLSSLEEE